MTILVIALFIAVLLLICASYLAFRFNSKAKAALLAQAGDSVIHGEAGRSLSKERMHISAANRAKGLVGEEGIGKRIEEIANRYGLTVLHDLSIPGSRANIDHILISRKAIFVLDAKNYQGKVSIGKSSTNLPVLKVGGRNCTNIATKLSRYAETLKDHLEESGIEATVVPLLAFYKANFDSNSDLQINGVRINLFGIEHEVKKYSLSQSPDIDIEKVAANIL